jgi:hypothetical protein
MIFRVVVLAISAVILCAWTPGRNIGGSYIASDATAVILLQLVEGPNGKLEGQLQGASIGSDGRLRSQSYTVSGTESEGKLVLMLAGSNSLSLFGTESGDRLLLNGWAQFGALEFVPGDLARFQDVYGSLQIKSVQAVAAISQREAQEKAMRADREFAAQLVNFVPEIQAFNAAQEQRIAQLSGARQRYASIVSTMQTYVERERHIVGGGQASVARGQLSVQVSQGSVAYQQAHVQFNWDAQILRAEINKLAVKERDAENRCTEIIKKASQVDPSDEAVSEAQPCKALNASADTFWKNTKALATALDSVEQAYRANYVQQNAIAAEADRIE